jgi:formate hydrogenlyase subunit 3/multisubunit Na+/H+ antiporter MnhD subunit
VTLFGVAIAILAAGGVAALLFSKRPGWALALGSGGAALGSLVGLAAALRALAGGEPQVASLPWSEPLAAVRLGLDPLSAFFLAALFALALPASIFGHGYMRRLAGPRPLGPFLLFYNLLLASIALVLAARQAVLFLVAWELMTVTSFLLVTFDDGDPEVRRAGLTYLVASHLATAFLFALFLLLGREAGSLDFEAFAALRDRPGVPAALFFGLALVGFGTKAGLVPLHVWLPEAHPAAPSQVSAILSGAMIKAGAYGILRTLSFLPAAPFSWGVLLAALGAAGGLAAILLALGQGDVKRALAYSSVENMGIILLGIGLGMAASAEGAALGAALSFAGALLHVWNHALMKGLAFMGAGALAHAAHTRDVERMGGLLSRLPRTAPLFLVGAVALSALPPLNGFVSEWLLYLGLLEATRAPHVGTPLAAALGLASLALVGALAAVAFTRLAGLALLGQPRSPSAARAEEPGPGSWIPLALLAAGCLGLALFPAEALSLAAPAIAEVARLPAARLQALVAGPSRSLALPIRAAALALGAAAALLWLWRSRLLAGRRAPPAETWGCGFARPSSRMQYTGSAYSQLLLSGLVPRLLAPRIRVVPPRGVFPGRSSLASVLREDPARRRLFDPVFRAVGQRFQDLRRFQAGKLHLQLLYTVVTLLALVLFFVLRHP